MFDASNPGYHDRVSILAMDLDNTILPAAPFVNKKRDLLGLDRLLSDQDIPTLVYATGRSFDSALAVLGEAGLPLPDVLISDVGTCLHRRSGTSWIQDMSFSDKLAAEWSTGDDTLIQTLLEAIEGLVLQPSERMSPFKISCFIAEGVAEDSIRKEVSEKLGAAGIPARIIISSGIEKIGLLDLLPPGGGKSVALDHLLSCCGLDRGSLVFAGDSGNDEDVLLSGCRAILVGNAESGFRDHLRKKAEAMKIEERLYFAEEPFLGGILEGCTRFGLISDDCSDTFDLKG